VVHQGGATQAAAFAVSEQMRDAGLKVCTHAGEASLKSQMKRADASGAHYAMIVGEEELGEGKVAIKALRGGAQGERFAQQQERVALDQASQILAKRLMVSVESTDGL